MLTWLENTCSYLMDLMFCYYLVDLMLEFKTTRSNSGRQPEHGEEIMDPNHSGEALVMMVEFKTAINAYLKELITSPVRSLADIIAFNERNSELVRKIALL